jgi:hypothetical protein
MKNKHLDLNLIIGLAVPAILVAAVAIAIYLPSLFHKPQYNFIYTSVSGYYYDRPNFKVVDKKISYSCPDPYTTTISACNEKSAKLYIHNVKNGTNAQISFTDAQKFSIRSDAKSLDGYSVGSSGYNNNIFSEIFGPHDYNYSDVYIKGHNQQHKINVAIDDRSVFEPFRFIGWIEE